MFLLPRENAEVLANEDVCREIFTSCTIPDHIRVKLVKFKAQYEYIYRVYTAPEA